MIVHYTLRELRDTESKRFRRDPSLTARHIRKYEVALSKMLVKVSKEVKDAFNQSLTTDSVRQMAVWRLDVSKFKKKLADIMDRNFREPATKETRKAIDGQIKRGVERSDQFLGQLNVMTVPVGGAPIDRQLYDLLHERALAEIMNVSDEVESRIIREVTAGITDGESIREITKRITEATDLGKSRAKRVARTETMHAFNRASKDRYVRHGVTKVKWKTGGSNICTHVKGFDGKEYSGGCLGLNNQIFEIDKAPPSPLHPNCKCILQPVIEEVNK